MEEEEGRDNNRSRYFGCNCSNRSYSVYSWIPLQTWFGSTWFHNLTISHIFICMVNVLDMCIHDTKTITDHSCNQSTYFLIDISLYSLDRTITVTCLSAVGKVSNSNQNLTSWVELTSTFLCRGFCSNSFKVNWVRSVLPLSKVYICLTLA